MNLLHAFRDRRVKEVFSTRTEEEGCSTSFIHIRRQRNNRRTRAKKKVRDERREAFLFPSCLWTLKKGILSRLNHDWSTSSLTHSRITLCRIWTRRPTFYRFQIQLSRIRKTVPWLPPDNAPSDSNPLKSSILGGWLGCGWSTCGAASVLALACLSHGSNAMNGGCRVISSINQSHNI